MSDLENNKRPDGQQEEQSTRVLQPLPADDVVPRVARRRRIEHIADPVINKAEEASAPVQQVAEEPVPAAPVQEMAEVPAEQPTQPAAPQEGGATTVQPVVKGQPAFGSRVSAREPLRREPPTQGIPRPEALRRADQAQQTAGADSAERPLYRQPVPAPGYTPSRPVGTMPRRPAIPKAEYLEEKPERKRGKGLVIAVAIVLVLALLVLGILLIPDSADGVLATVKQTASGLLSGLTGGEKPKPTEEPPTALDFYAALTQVNAGETVTFNLTTTKNATAVRLLDKDGNALYTQNTQVDNTDSLIWIIKMIPVEPYDGPVTAQVSDGENWIDTGMEIDLEVISTAALPVETATPEYVTQAPVETTPEPAEEATETPAPTQEPQVTPTLAITPTPTIPPMQTTPEPEVVPAAAMTDVPPVESPIDETEPDEEPIPDEIDPDETFVEDEPDNEYDPDEYDPDEYDPDETFVEDEPDETEPEETAAPTVTAAPAVAAEDETEPLEVIADEKASPALISAAAIYDGSKHLTSYMRDEQDIIDMPAAGAYTRLPYGVLTFRGNAFRQNAAEGAVGELSEMAVLWKTAASSAKGSGTTYYGINYTGQPAIIKWSTEVRGISNFTDDAKATKGLTEVIVAGDDGRIYFLDLRDGEATRSAINVGYPLRGTPSIHPYGFPLMSVGQYARKMSGKTGDIGLRIYSLVNQKQLSMLDGLDKNFNRPYYKVGSFETSSLYDPKADTMISAGTNGLLYLTKLNTRFEYNATTGEGSMNISPTSVVLKSKAKGEDDKLTAIESSIAMYQNYVFYADMKGILRCVDTTTLETKWAVATGDAVEAAVALDLDEDGTLWLYTANTMQNRKKGACTIRRFNAATGAQDWALEVPVTKSTKYVAGFRASPVIGQNDLGDYVYFTVSGVSKAGGKDLGFDGAVAGALLCVDKADGSVVWTKSLGSYSYSSPVAVYTEEGAGWIVQAASNGTLYLLDGLTGETVDTLKLDGTINASPAVYKSTLVIGTTGKGKSAIYGIELK